MSGPQSRSAKPGQQFFVTRLFNQHAASGRACLAGVLHDRIDQCRQRGVENGIRKHDLRRLASEFQRHRAMAPCGSRGNPGAGGRRSGERDMVHARVLDQRGASLLPQARDDVQRTRRQPRAGSEFGHAQHRQARVLRRLDHARIARRKRATRRTSEDLQRIVPRNDVPGDAVRFPPSQYGEPLGIGKGLAVQLVARAAIEFEIACARDDVRARLRERLAAIARLGQRQFLRVIENRAR
jgi:hypothetical protein